ncbi:MAG: nitroreductase family protein [Candidatus Ranarchaeia archaeon]
MGLYDLILSRRSIRHYKQKEVSEKILFEILEAGRQAPSAKNLQPWHFIIIKNEEVRNKFSKWRYSSFLIESPVIIVGLADKSNKSVSKWSTIDTTIALQNMVIAAHSFGLGTCWVGCFEENEAKEVLGIPTHLEIVAMLSLGYPNEKPEQRRRKIISDIVSFEKWG